MRISDWSSDVCSSDLPTVSPASRRRFSETAMVRSGRWAALRKQPGTCSSACVAARCRARSWRGVSPVMSRKVRPNVRSEEHTSELQSLMRISYAVFCLKKKSKHLETHKNHIYYNECLETNL